MKYLSGKSLAQPIDDELQVVAVDLRRHVEPQPVGAVLFEVHAGVLVEEVLHLALPPRRSAAPVGPLSALEVDAALVACSRRTPRATLSPGPAWL